MSLSMRALQVSVGKRRLLGPVDLALSPGRCLGVVGESGSGKSLSALSLLGLLPPGLRAHAHVHYDDGGAAGNLVAEGSITPPNAAHAALRGRVLAWVPQDPLAALHPLRSIGAQLLETLRLHDARARDVARQRARQLLQRVHLPDPDAALKRYPHQFSGGQRQRIAIALALASNPRYLIADEPTSALDARIAREVLDLLDALRREEGLGLMLISHDLPLVGAYADEVLVLRHGQVVERGTTREVFAAPKHAYTRELIEADRLPEPLPLTHARGARVSLSPHGGERVPDRAGEGSPLLRAENMRMHYPRAASPALDDVSLILRRGEGLALLGESGSGKSTLGRAVLRLLRGAQGRVWLDDVELTALSPAGLRAQRKRIGVVFQDPYASLDPRMRVGEIITEPLRIHGLGNIAERATRAEQLLQTVGLDAGMATRYPHQFSGGQRQRIAIARALACDPDLLVCDEAVSALDAHHRREILGLLATLKRERALALLFVTHDLSAAAAVAERIVVLEAGRIVEVGDTATVLQQPQHAHTQALVAARAL